MVTKARRESHGTSRPRRPARRDGMHSIESSVPVLTHHRGPGVAAAYVLSFELVVEISETLGLKFSVRPMTFNALPAAGSCSSKGRHPSDQAKRASRGARTDCGRQSSNWQRLSTCQQSRVFFGCAARSSLQRQPHNDLAMGRSQPLTQARKALPWDHSVAAGCHRKVGC